MNTEIIERLPGLMDFTQEQVEILRPHLQEVHFQAGEKIFNQGDPATHLYFVAEGEVSILFDPEDGPVITVAAVGTGDIFGWSSTLGSQLYTSGAVCTETGSFLRLEGECLRGICQNNPETGILILNKLAAVIAQRLRGTHEQVVKLLHQGINHRHPTGEDHE
jgi:CRP-like cAMP-binding protein